MQTEWFDKDNRKRLYTPDVLVESYDKKPIVYEVKYTNELTELLSEDRHKFRAVIGYALEKGWRFKFYTKTKVSSVFIKDVRFLLLFCMTGSGRSITTILRRN
ncbi:MAG: TnsA endonuclease N-terminal domain-containing protein [Alcanivoracaceae bacterium]|nr:TnsA endonuclease N-terminal domain-containing protein [Alcanivoracaceae bacterium]